jgi:hypothetical protein
MFRRNWPQKPPVGTPLCEDTSLRAGLASLWLLNEGCGLPFDAAAKQLATAMSAAWSPGQYGTGLSLNGTSQSVTLPANPALAIAGPLSIVACCAPAASTTNQHVLDVRPVSPLLGGYYLEFDAAGSNEFGLFVGTTAGPNNLPSSSAGAVDGNLHVFAVTLAGTGAGQVAFYRDGQPWGTATSAYLPGFTGTIVPRIGTNYLASGAWFKGPVYWIGLWNRALLYPEVVAVSSHPNAIARLFEPSRIQAAIPAALVPGIYAVTPAAIPANHAGAIALSAHGYSLGWTAGIPGSPTLTVSGPTGTAKLSQTIVDPSDATVNVTTGAGTGAATISDGTHSITFQVVQPALAVSPTTMTATGTYTVTAAGTGTLWTTSSPTGLFTSSIGTVSNVSVQSNTLATFTLTLGSSQAGGTATITDTSTGVTAVIAVNAVYTGSIHLGGQCLLQHATGNTGLFASKPAASLSFFVKIDSNAGLNLAAGTAIVKWAGGTNAAVYHPDTGNLILTLPGASSNVSATVPVQLGTGYHVALSWAAGSQAIYLNGQLLKSGTVAGNTASVTGLQVGGDGGAGIALDHHVSDLAAWGSYALSAADALALANRTSTPLQIATPASAWWPLGGGTNGTAPALADLGLADFAGNGNGLAVASGALSNAAYAAPQAITSPVNVVAQVVKSGKLALFGTMCAGLTNGANAGACVAAVNATPTVYRNGNAVSIGPAVWFNTTLDVPFVAYQLQCGSVQNVAIPNGGAGYTGAPTAAINNAGTGGSGLVLGTPVLSSGVTGYAITGAGSGYNQPPTVTFSGGGGTVQATGHAVVWKGMVTEIILDTPGSGYTSAPTIAFSGGASGSGAQASATIAGGAVVGVAVTAPGSGYANAPAVTIAAPPGTAGPTGNLTAQALAIVGDANYATPGGIRAIIPLVGGLMGCGSGYASAPAVKIAAPASGVTATATASVSQYVSNIPVTTPGSGYNSPPAITFSGGNTITGTLNGTTSVTSVSSTTGIYVGQPISGANIPANTTVAAIGSGTLTLSQAATGSATGEALTLGVTQATVAPIMTGSFAATTTGTLASGSAIVTAIASTAGFAVGMSVSGTGIPAGATIASVDSGTQIHLSANATASGAQTLSVLDTFIYTATANWLAVNTYNGPSPGILPAATNASMANWTGQMEGAAGGMNCFAQAPTMIAGGNMGAQPINRYTSTYFGENLFHRADLWHPVVGSVGAGVLTYGADRATPTSWTNPSTTVLRSVPYDPSAGNALDGMTIPAWYGQFTLRYDDSQVNTPNAAAFWATALSASFTTTPIPQSGDATVVTLTQAQVNSNVTITSGGVTAISLAGVTFASTYQGAGVIVAGGGGSGFAGTVNLTAGTPTSINVACPGTNYSKTGLVVTIYGTSVSGTAVTAVFDVEPVAAPTSWDPTLAVSWAQPQGLNTISNPWLVPPVAATRKANLSFDRTRPLAMDPNVAGYLTSGGKSIGIARFMDRTLGFGGWSGAALPSDLPNVANGTFWATLSQRAVAAYFQYARFLNTNPAKGPVAGGGDGTYPAVTTKCYSQQAWGSTLDPPFTISANTVAGSPTVTVPAMASSGLMAGATVTGPGIPANSVVAFLGASVIGTATDGSGVIRGIASTAGLSAGMPVYGVNNNLNVNVTVNNTIASVDSATQITLTKPVSGGGAVNLNVGYTSMFTLGSKTAGDTANATATATGATLTIQNPGYISLPATDDGFFVGGFNAAMVIELRSTTPHGLRAGDQPAWGGDIRVPPTNSNNTGVGFNVGWSLAGTLSSGSAVVTGLSSANLYTAGSTVLCMAVTPAGTLASGSPIVTGLPSTTGLAVGMPVSGTGITAGTTVLSVDSGTQIHLSANATAGGAQTLTISTPSLSGSLTNNSAVVTGLASTSALAVGMGVLGANIPAGASIQSIDSLTQIHLTANATGGGTQSLTFSFLPGGTTIASVQSSSQFTLSQNSPVAFPATLLVNSFAPIGGYGANVWVTGPYTVAISVYVAGGAPGLQPGGPQGVNSTVEIPLASTAFPSGWSATNLTPFASGANSEPYEFGAGMTAQLPGMILWVNIPMAASDDLATLIASKIAAVAAPNAVVYLEYANECWNGAMQPNGWLPSVTTLMGYATSGTIMGHAPAPTEALFGYTPACALLGAHLYDAFTAAWVAAGRPAANVHRVQGSWHGGGSGGLALNNLAYNDTYLLLRLGMEWGLAPDHVAIAPYLSIPYDWPVLRAFAQAGSPFGGAGSLPIDAMNDLYRFQMAYSQGNWAQVAAHAQYLVNYGQPIEAAVAGQTTGGGSIPASTYYAYYTFVDGSGRETTVGLSASGALALMAGNTLTINMPVLPSWAPSINFYLSQPNGALGAPPLSLGSVARSQYGPGKTYPVGSAVPFAALPGTRTSPPSTNQAAANSKVPTLVAYEGAATQGVPNTLPFNWWLQHDSFAHPSGRDLVWGWYAALQQGSPIAPGSGFTAANYFQVFDSPQYGQMWVLSYDACQPPGLGASNAFATIQGGQPADGHDHNQYNQSPYFQGLVDFFSVSSPTPVQPVPTRRTRPWFNGLSPSAAGLSRPAVRMGR